MTTISNQICLAFIPRNVSYKQKKSTVQFNKHRTVHSPSVSMRLWIIFVSFHSLVRQQSNVQTSVWNVIHPYSVCQSIFPPMHTPSVCPVCTCIRIHMQNGVYVTHRRTQWDAAVYGISMEKPLAYALGKCMPKNFSLWYKRLCTVCRFNILF